MNDIKTSTLCSNCGGYLTIVRIEPEGNVLLVCYKCGVKNKVCSGM